MRFVTAVVASCVLLAPIARAQDAEAAPPPSVNTALLRGDPDGPDPDGPDPDGLDPDGTDPEAPAASAHDAEDGISDQELVRWASREVGREEGRPIGERPPIPPDQYLAESHHLSTQYAVVAPIEQDLLRVFAELGLGALGLGIGGGTGALLILGADQAGGDPTWTVLAAMGAVMLGSVALTSGVTLGADLTHGRGNFGHAFLGMLAGAAAAIPLVVLGMDEHVLEAALVAAGVLPLAGAVLGYEIGHADTEGGTDRPTLSVLAAPTPTGATLAVLGSLP
ncbi:MAG: hypothetical protein AB7S26_22545 [Sandaracinaceae bacterium]